MGTGGEGKRRKTATDLPFVLYHGSRGWRAPRSLADVVELEGAEGLTKYVPNFEYWLCDLAAYRVEELRGGARVGISLAGLKYVFSADLNEKLKEIVKVFSGFPPDDVDALESMGMVLLYWSIARGLEREAVRQAFGELFGAQEEGAMASLLEKLQEMRDRQLIELDREEAIQEDMRELIQKGYREAQQS